VTTGDCMSVTIKNHRSRLITAKTNYSQISIFFMFLLLFLFGQKVLLAGNTAELFWIAPGDNLAQDQAYKYDIRYSSIPIGADTTNWWNYALDVDSVPSPALSGSKDSCMIHDLSIESNYYVAIRTADLAYNWSDISNVAEISSILCIDMTQDGTIDILDILCMLDFLYKDGPPLPSESMGDVDNSGEMNILDVLYIINFCYKEGPPPDCGN